MRTFAQKPKAVRHTTSATAKGGTPATAAMTRVRGFAGNHSMRTRAGSGWIPINSQATARIQPQLTVNTPGDTYEQEADRVAEQVMRVPDSQVLQRECVGCDDEGKKGLLLQRKATGGVAGAEAPPIVHEVLRSPGRPLDQSTRAFMEPRFGRDFSDVRVHTDAKAAESAKAIKAKAYTVSNHIVFQAGPGEVKASPLVAHELAHTAQQKSNLVSRQPAAKMSNETKRQKIVSTALSLSNEHYLLGAAGEIPGEPGLSHRKVSLVGHKALINLNNGSCGQRGKNEDCDKKQHFDCGGFVAYCYHSVCPEVKYPGPASGLKAMNWVARKSKDEIVAGDIAYTNTHVGICIDKTNVISAANSKSGVKTWGASSYSEFGYLGGCLS